MRKIDENNELEILSNFIKDEMESSYDAQIYTDDNDDSEEDRFLDLDKMCVADNKISVVSSGVSRTLKTHLKEYFSLV